MDPLLDPELEAALSDAAATPVYSAAYTSLPHLFRTALITVGKERGPRLLQRDLANWRRLNDEARAALSVGDRQVAQARIEAVRAEQIRLVVNVLGHKAVHRAVQDVGVSLARAGIELNNAEIAGKEVRRARAMTAQVNELMQRANVALERSDHEAALDQLTRASDLLDGVAHFLITLQRIPALETLFEEAVARAGRQQHRAALDSMLASLDTLNADARRALRNGQRERAQRSLEAVRKEQIRVVLSALDSGTVHGLIKQVDAGLAVSAARVNRLTDVRLRDRASRMLDEASSLIARAHKAHEQRAAATALDLASHAAGLVNALQHLLPR